MAKGAGVDPQPSNCATSAQGSDPCVAFSHQRQLEEIQGLARAIDLEVVATQVCPLPKIRPATYFRQGHLEDAAQIITTQNIEIVIADTLLTPGQQRNLERELNVKVLDRTGLILEIFGARALTREGRLQVDLAHLTYQKSRLVRSWTHLERQRGGAGFLGGPGETQLEADRRALSGKIARLEKALEDVRRTRGLHRKGREKAPHTMIALIGYTNAGKSTLFNRLTNAEVLAKDQLFATLDPTMRALRLARGSEAILSDTVRFISNLPTELIAAFRATLEEVERADVLLHVRDISDPEFEAQGQSVNEILAQMGLEGDSLPPVVEVYNKSDLVGHGHPNRDKLDSLKRRLMEEQCLNQGAIVSARTGHGLDGLLTTLERIVQRRDTVLDLDIEPDQGRVIAWLHEHADILSRKTGQDGTVHVSVSLNPQNLGRFEKEFGRLADA